MIIKSEVIVFLLFYFCQHYIFFFALLNSLFQPFVSPALFFISKVWPLRPDNCLYLISNSSCSVVIGCHQPRWPAGEYVAFWLRPHVGEKVCKFCVTLIRPSLVYTYPLSLVLSYRVQSIIHTKILVLIFCLHICNFVLQYQPSCWFTDSKIEIGGRAEGSKEEDVEVLFGSDKGE